MTTELMAQAKQVKGVYVYDLLSKRNVVGVGLGYKISQGINTGELCLVVSVTHKVDPSALAAEDLPQADYALHGARMVRPRPGILNA